MERDLKLVLTAVDNTQKTLNDITKRFDSLDKSVSKATDSTKKMESQGMSLGKLAPVIASVFAVDKIMQFGKESVLAFQESEKAAARLTQISTQVTGATQDQINGFKDLAAQLQQLGVVEDDAIIAGQSQIASFARNAETVSTLSTSLADLAVAQYGVNVSQDQAIQTGNLLGKMLSGNLGAATKAGILVTAEQEKAFKSANSEQERAAIIAKVVSDNYGGLNEAMRATSAGGIQAMKNQIGDLKEQLGGALTPSIKLLQSELLKTISGLNAGGNAFEGIGAFVFRAVNLLSAFINSIKMTGQVVILVAQTISKAFQAIKGAIEPIGLLFQGKFKEAKEAMKENTMEGITGVLSTLKTGLTNIKTTQDGITNNLKQMITASDFKPAETALANVSNKAKAAGATVGEASKEVTKALSDMKTSYKDTMESAQTNLFELEQDHKSKMASIRSEMEKTSQEMTKLQESFNQQKSSDEMGIAGQIVANEERVAAIQTELAGSVSAQRRAELQAELDQRLLATQANAEFIAQFEAQIAEVKRRNALTDLERAIEDFNLKRSMATQEFNEKMAMLAKEMSALRSKEKEEQALYESKKAFIEASIATMEKMHAETSANAVKVTKDQIEKEIEYYKQLAEAIKAARSGNTAQFDRIKTTFNGIGSTTAVNDAIISPRGDIVTTHPNDWLIATKNPQSLEQGGGGAVSITITGNSFMGEADMAEKVGDQILNILKGNMQLSTI